MACYNEFMNVIRKLINYIKVNIGRIIPAYAVLPLIFCVLVNNVVYFIFRLFVQEKYHYDFSTSLDRMIPFVPAWVSIYLICYLFWIFNYILIARQEKEHFYRFVTADILSRLACGIFFLVIPTITVRPEVIGNGLWENLIRLVYMMDEPTNLFPSIHCLTSWYCYIGIRGKKNVPVWYQRFSLIFAILVFLSTQFTKQHYLVDIAGGAGLAQLFYMLCQRYDWYQPVMRLFERDAYEK